MQHKRRLSRWSSIVSLIVVLVYGVSVEARQAKSGFSLNSAGYFEERGCDVLVFNNWYDGNFSDAKMSGVEIIHHGVRTATNGDVRLSPTPAQWDPIPRLVRRTVVRDSQRVDVELEYPGHDFSYTVHAEAQGRGILVRVALERPLPHDLAGRAGFNLEFLPPAYWGKGYLIDGRGGVFPLSAGGPMVTTPGQDIEPAPLGKGKNLVLAPEEPERRIHIQSLKGDLLLYDGRDIAQNGWYVVRTLLPSNKTGTVVEWYLEAGTVPGWTRLPVIAHSQVGYLPEAEKVAVIELDPNDRTQEAARLLQVEEDGRLVDVYHATLHRWGRYLRYDYSLFDFSLNNFSLPRAFPDIIDRESVFRGLDYLFGCHPGSDISFVSGVGSRSKRVVYGNNRADFTSIPGGVVPGVLIVKPDFPENKEDWPFLWGENEYVVNLGVSYVELVLAAESLRGGE